MESAVAEKKKSPAGGPPCWKGKKIHPTKPTKMKGGKRVNNCIDAGTSESFDPSAVPAEYDELMDIYYQIGEEALADEMGLSAAELDQEISELAHELDKHADDDRDELILQIIDDTLSNADRDAYEEVEQVDELSKKTLGSYIKKAAVSSTKSAHNSNHTTPERQKKHLDTVGKRFKGINTATNKLTKEGVEQVDEISQDMKNRYKASAEKDVEDNRKISKRMSKWSKQSQNPGVAIDWTKKSKKFSDKADKRSANIKKYTVDEATSISTEVEKIVSQFEADITSKGLEFAKPIDIAGIVKATQAGDHNDLPVRLGYDVMDPKTNKRPNFVWDIAYDATTELLNIGKAGHDGSAEVKNIVGQFTADMEDQGFDVNNIDVAELEKIISDHDYDNMGFASQDAVDVLATSVTDPEDDMSPPEIAFDTAEEAVEQLIKNSRKFHESATQAIDRIKCLSGIITEDEVTKIAVGMGESVHENQQIDESYPMGMDADNNTNINFNQTKKMGDATLNINVQAKDMAELQKVLQMAGLDPEEAEKHMPEPDSVQVVDVEPVADSPCGGDAYTTDKQALVDMLRDKLQQKLS